MQEFTHATNEHRKYMHWKTHTAENSIHVSHVIIDICVCVCWSDRFHSGPVWQHSTAAERLPITVHSGLKPSLLFIYPQPPPLPSPLFPFCLTLNGARLFYIQRTMKRSKLTALPPPRLTVTAGPSLQASGDVRDRHQILWWRVHSPDHHNNSPWEMWVSPISHTNICTTFRVCVYFIMLLHWVTI